MKKIIGGWISLCTAFALFSTSLYAAPEAFTLDSSHTYVLWNIKHMGFSTQSGKWYVTGQLVLDKDHPEQSKVNVSIDLANMVTGLPELDKHLKSQTFFDVEHYPKATFVSNKVEVNGKNTANVNGILTLHGVSKPVVLHVTLNKAGMNPITNKMTVGFSATAEVKRSDFGMTAYLPGLSDEVEINIGAEAYQDKK